MIVVLFSFSCRFLMIDVGSYGRQSDGGVFGNSGLGKAMAGNRLVLPPNRSLDGSTRPMPFVFIGDEAFPLQYHLLRPYPGRNLTDVKRSYNYRLSRARRVVENAFGILSQRFRIFQRPIAVGLSTLDDIVKCACVLHNFLLRQDGMTQSKPDLPECPLAGIRSTGGNASTAALAVRDTFAAYFATTGAIPWSRTPC